MFLIKYGRNLDIAKKSHIFCAVKCSICATRDRERERGDWPLWKRGFEFFVLSSWPAGVTDVANSKIAVDRFSLSRQGFLLFSSGLVIWTGVLRPKFWTVQCRQSSIFKATKFLEK